MLDSTRSMNSISPDSAFVSSNMNRTLICVFFVSLFLFLHLTKSDEEEVRSALTNFITKLTESNGVPGGASPWNLTSDPCKDGWEGVTCDNRDSLKNITLDGYKFSGIFDAGLLCDVESLAASLTILSLNDNNVEGQSLEKIGNCRQLTQLYLRGNRFSGSLPDSFSRLNNLKRLDISGNNFSASLPDLSRISGLTDFFAQNNEFSGAIPEFKFSNIVNFNVSSNNFRGPIPSGGNRFPESSFLDNPELCGNPLPNICPSVSSESSDKPKGGLSKDKILRFSGYILIGLAVVILITMFLCRKRKKQEVQIEAVAKVAAIADSINKPSYTPMNFKTSTLSKSDVLPAAGDQSATVSSSLILLTSPDVNGVKFDNLLKAPAELLGRGKHGSVYKVLSEDLGMTLAVKRIKDWVISSNDFKQRMLKLDRVKHPNVLPAIAYYSSRQEKLLVYEYQQNGSLFRLLHGSQNGQAFYWSSRLSVAATIADALAFMHQQLRDYGIAHGNLKSSNVLLNKNMGACISEYGLMLDSQDPSLVTNVNLSQEKEENHPAFKADIYSFGVILLELLTGKLVQNNGLDLASWVVSVVKEEWTVEVFDKTLIQEGATEERMVNLLQIAIKCVNRSTDARPGINQISRMINTLKEEEERSMDVSGMASSISIA